MPYSVLFVCLGNICRSPLAEAAFKQEVHKRNLPIHVESAGIGPWHINQPPDPRAIRQASQHGIDIRHYKGRQINATDFLNFSHIIAMDKKNIAQLVKLAPKMHRSSIKLFMDYVPDHKQDEIPDPYYGDEKDFQKTWEQVSLGAFHLANYFEELILKNSVL
ncbi:Low molecular weight protein-tyrosine-phosphatase YfkJ [Commensalibacter sp. Nvir]|uniref:low molecular weight protein-tyrosine-phosphatase n=1 Tax=Commensalibacter sp. Nvir TaxID=3069817 RepID=UPI002D67EB92|nr:Low molecular weight protein-tyrosine-phosphatase YfkJ [Commensalibacter sp. Nvir]